MKEKIIENGIEYMDADTLNKGAKYEVRYTL